MSAARETAGKLTILIASPLEDEHVARIRAFDPDRFDVIHEPELLAKPRYVADHGGEPRNFDEGQKARWADCLKRADIFFDFDRMDAAGMPVNAPNLRWVQATSSGIGEFLRRTALDKSNILFTTASGVHARPLAEFAILGLLYFFRDVPYLNAEKQAHRYERYTAQGMEGARVLVVGLGSLGATIALDCSRFGIEVWGTRRRSGVEAPEGVSRVVDQRDIKSVLPDVDAVILCCPLTEETRGLIGAPEIQAMKPGAVIVNISRGQVIDEEAMIEALASRHLKGAALDVFAVEPLPKESPLWDLPNVLISPHSASTVHLENTRIVDIFLENLGRFVAGQPLRNLYDRESGY